MSGGLPKARVTSQGSKTLVTVQNTARAAIDQLCALWLSRKGEVSKVETRDLSTGSFQFRLTPAKPGESIDRVIVRDCRSVGIEDVS